jgi:hypothetical protein
MARCPAHQDRGPSLSISESAGKPLVHCFGGCTQATVIDALRAKGLWSERTPRTWTPAERRDWRAERREIERDLPAARLWRRAAVSLAEAVLVDLKAALFDPTLPRPECGEIAVWTQRLARWERLDGAALAAEYRARRELQPDLTAALVSAAVIREKADRRALWRFVQTLHPRGAV